MEATIGRKEKDFSTLASKLDDEQSIVGKVQKSIKEVQGRVEEMEEELWMEKEIWVQKEVYKDTVVVSSSDKDGDHVN